MLRAADEEAREVWNWHIGYAAAEGAATGGFGLAGIAADIPALFAILIREVKQIGVLQLRHNETRGMRLLTACASHRFHN